MNALQASDTDEHEGPPEYWITYSDLMVSLLMVFALLLFLALSQYQGGLEAVAQSRQESITTLSRITDSLSKEGVRIAYDSATNTLRFAEDVLFAKNDSELNPEGLAAAQTVARRVLPALLHNRVIADQLQEIVIEGHASPEGTFEYNLGLSQRRANAVLTAILEGTAPDSLVALAQVRNLLTASGWSYWHPLMNANGIDSARSRRIEIQIRFKADSLVRDLIRKTIRTQ